MPPIIILEHHARHRRKQKERLRTGTPGISLVRDPQQLRLVCETDETGLFNQPIKQLTNQNQPLNYTVKPTNQPVNYPLETNQPINERNNQPLNLPNLPPNQRTAQHTNQ